MYIKKVVIENFKRFRGRFSVELNNSLNILVGDNEAGKSTILEAINLALTGTFNGRYMRNELSQYLINLEAVNDYLKSVEVGAAHDLPSTCIELYFEGEGAELLEGDGNSDKIACPGLSFRIEFDEQYKDEYEELVKKGGIKSIPVEYYHVVWRSFSRESLTAKRVPLSSALIDSSASSNINGSDQYVSRIIKDLLSVDEVVSVSQSHRLMKEQFMDDASIKDINKKVSAAAKVTNKTVKISVEMAARNAWESGLTTFIDDVPFGYVGKGEQSTIKTHLALSNDKAKKAGVVLIEEPENHLSHTKLNSLLESIKSSHAHKQMVVATHSSFVANKLGLDDLILLKGGSSLRLNELSADTKEFFQKIAGYDTLRLILCEKAILVEGDSDELVVQKAYMSVNGGVLPIQNGVEVISVGISFLRFLEVAKKLSLQVAVVTDNDGDIAAIKKKYSDYLGVNEVDEINIYYDPDIDVGDLMIGKKPFNYNTMEPKFVKMNGLMTMNDLLDKDYETEDELHRYMKGNKTDCALKIFNTDKEFTYPKYILDSVNAK